VSEESTTPDLVELVERFNDAWNRQDVDAFLSVVTLDVVYRPITTWPEPQERRGSDEVRRFFIHDPLDAWTDDFTSKPETIREHGNAVIALLRFTGHARASGVEIGGGVFRVFRSRDGQIAQIEDFTDRAEARAAAESVRAGSART
jgi:ketosteroid isomerase-like protein